MKRKTAFAKALQRARPRIASGCETTICLALKVTGGSKFRPQIMDQLDGRWCYVGWMVHNHPKTYQRMTTNDFRDGRLQWIDHMIEIESEK